MEKEILLPDTDESVIHTLSEENETLRELNEKLQKDNVNLLKRMSSIAETEQVLEVCNLLISNIANTIEAYSKCINIITAKGE